MMQHNTEDAPGWNPLIRLEVTQESYEHYLNISFIRYSAQYDWSCFFWL